MVVAQMKCGKCGRIIEAEILDREDPKEKNERGEPIRCPHCHSSMIETIRVLRHKPR